MTASYGIKEGWKFTTKNQGTTFAAHMGNTYTNNVQEAVEQLAQDMNAKIGSKERIDTLKGFIAEYWHADTFNIDAALNGSASNAVIERSNDMGSVDVSTNFGSNYSMKYYATGVDSARQQATNVIQAYHKYLKRSKTATPMTFEEYIAKNGYPNEMQELLKSVYNGQGRVIPTEQLQDAITFLKEQISKEEAKGRTHRLTLFETYKETLQNLTDRIKDGNGVESRPLTKEEAEAIAALCKLGEFKSEDFGFSLNELITTEYLLQQALQAGFTSAMITLVMQMGPEIYKAIDYLIKNGEIDVEQLKSSGLKALSASAEGFLRGSISASLTIACKAGKLGVGFKNVTPGMVGAVTVIVLDTMKNSCHVACAKMTTREMGTQLTKEILISSASLAGGTVGQMVLPELPVLGYMLGSFVGSIVASLTINMAEKTILSFCADTGFSFFGLVDQNYELPKEIIERLGLDVISLNHIETKKTVLQRTSMKRTNLNKTRYNTIEIMVLRRGVVGINKIGYVI